MASWLTPALRRKVHLLGKQEAVDWPVFGWALAQNGVIGVERGAADLDAFRAAKRILDEGHVLAIFPEGTRSPDGRLQEAKNGAALLALRTGASDPAGGRLGHGPVLAPAPEAVPARRARPDASRQDRSRCRRWTGIDRRRAPGEATRLIMTRIAELLPPRQRGVYAAEVDRLRGE